MRYIIARQRWRMVQVSNMAYVARSLQLAPQSMYLPKGWYETVFSDAPSDNRTADQIADDVLNKMMGGKDEPA